MNITGSILTVVFIFSCFVLNGQDSTNHKLKRHVSDDGKLYWPGTQPLYLYVGDNPNGDDLKRLESETSSKYANPMYLDTEGINYIRSKWAVDETGKYASPRQEVLFEIYKDSNPPNTTSVQKGSPTFVEDNIRYYGQGLNVNLTSKDAISGMNTIYLSLNSAPYQSYSEPIKPTADGSYEYRYYAVDHVGNVENIKTLSFVLDVTPPSTKHSVTGEKLGDVLSPQAKISLSSSDESSKVRSITYRFDENSLKTYTGDLSLTSLTEGEHTLTYLAEDKVLNKEEPKSYSFYLDKTPPEVQVSVIGDQYQNKGRVFVSTRSRVKLEAKDNKSGIKKITYRIDDKDEKDYTEPFDLPSNKGTHEIKFYAEDQVGNTYITVFDESKHGRQALDLDIQVPEIEYSFDGAKHVSRDTMFITSKTPIALKATDDGSGVNSIGYKINGGKGEQYSEPFTIDNEGLFQVDFYATDFVNNRNIAEFFFVIDNTGPEISTILSMMPNGEIKLDELDEPLSVYSSHVKLYLGATDHIVNSKNIYYTLNDDPEKIYSKPIVLSEKGINSFSVRAVDMLGNESKTEIQQIFVR